MMLFLFLMGYCAVFAHNKAEVVFMADYKEMYYALLRATEKAINELTAAQQKCEDMFIESNEHLHLIQKEIKQ